MSCSDCKPPNYGYRVPHLATSRTILLWGIRFYQRASLRLLFPPACRFYPHLFPLCLQRLLSVIGAWRGGWMGLKRGAPLSPFSPRWI
ncbi:MAG UNVERIFIED_CONTAM: membrane protein insertion efficiency factor YidD [Anaerolineae bacterium]